jgi:hypothetical protein
LHYDLSFNYGSMYNLKWLNLQNQLKTYYPLMYSRY